MTRLSQLPAIDDDTPPSVGLGPLPVTASGSALTAMQAALLRYADASTS